MRFVIRKDAGPNTIFAADAFDNQIGNLVPVNFRETEDGPVKAKIGNARLVSAQIAEHGKVAILTLEIQQSDDVLATITAERVLRQIGEMSFAPKP